ncbi:MAG: alpha-E domain-containing protein [Lachnospiraceae bacterium]|nr:alpha-E domain-containing protein [Lachnospiraceae bacterium]
MGIISVENTDRLFWLGRYSERVYTTIKLFAESFDSMIDMDELGSLDGFCKKLEIPNIYTSGEDFVARYCFDPEDPNSIYSNLTRAYDNCIVLREEIGSDTISYIQLAMYEMNKARISPSPLIELQRVLDDILAFWGIVDDEIDSENVRNIIKVGKRVERLDLYARLRMSREEMKREVDRLSGRIWRTCLKYRQTYLDDLSQLVEEPRIDYLAIVQKTERLLEGQE